MKDRQISFSRREMLQAASCLGLLGLNPAAGAGTPGRTQAGEFAEQKTDAAPTRSPLVIGYFPYWSKLGPERFDYSQYTHICHAFAWFDKGGVLRFPENAQTQALIAAAHAKNARVLLSLGGEDSNAALRAQNAETLADALAKRIQTFRYDGIDVDWEGQESAKDGAKLVALVQALRKRLPKSLLTMAVPGGDYFGRWFSTAPLLAAADWINIMTYDYAGPWCDTLNHNAPLPEVQKAVAYWKGRGWPVEKLLLGIPSYGRRMHGRRFGDPAPAGTYVGDEVSYNDAQKFLKDGWKPMRDGAAQTPYLVSPKGNELISYEDASSAHRKGALARSLGLRGLFFWEMTHDFDGKANVLVRAAREGWKG